jgi:hypothetical protein
MWKVSARSLRQRLPYRGARECAAWPAPARTTALGAADLAQWRDGDLRVPAADDVEYAHPDAGHKVGMAWALSFWVGGPLEEVDGLLFDVPNWAQDKPLRGADELGRWEAIYTLLNALGQRGWQVTQIVRNRPNDAYAWTDSFELTRRSA